MFIAMNRFRIAEGKEADFEQGWRDRTSHLATVPGFVRFALLRGDARGEYISHSTWADRAAFEAWTKSEAFAAGHRGASLAGVIEGPPQISLYESVLEETATAR